MAVSSAVLAWLGHVQPCSHRLRSPRWLWEVQVIHIRGLGTAEHWLSPKKTHSQLAVQTHWDICYGNTQHLVAHALSVRGQLDHIYRLAEKAHKRGGWYSKHTALQWGESREEEGREAAMIYADLQSHLCLYRYLLKFKIPNFEEVLTNWAPILNFLVTHKDTYFSTLISDYCSLLFTLMCALCL